MTILSIIGKVKQKKEWYKIIIKIIEFMLVVFLSWNSINVKTQVNNANNAVIDVKNEVKNLNQNLNNLNQSVTIINNPIEKYNSPEFDNFLTNESGKELGEVRQYKYDKSKKEILFNRITFFDNEHVDNLKSVKKDDILIFKERKIKVVDIGHFQNDGTGFINNLILQPYWKDLIGEEIDY